MGPGCFHRKDGRGNNLAVWEERAVVKGGCRLPYHSLNECYIKTTKFTIVSREKRDRFPTLSMKSCSNSHILTFTSSICGDMSSPSA